MRVLVTGATGLIGTALQPVLKQRGHEVVTLSRSARDGAIRWNPARGEIDRARLAGFDAVVHLAGANLAEGRWTTARKREIRDSRVEGTRLLIDALKEVERPPAIFVSASAVGYYGDTGDREVDESAPPGKGFLPEVCAAWEAQAQAAAAFAKQVTIVRFGVVLAREGGPVAKMLPIFKAGMGGRAGDGRQWLSWIARDDLAALLGRLLESPLEGVLNAVAPQPVTNGEFAATLGRVLHRPAAVPAPAAALKLAFGKMAEETILASTRVRSARLPELDFNIRFPQLEPALRHVLSGD